jgi:hypothetical protein
MVRHDSARQGMSWHGSSRQAMLAWFCLAGNKLTWFYKAGQSLHDLQGREWFGMVLQSRE